MTRRRLMHVAFAFALAVGGCTLTLPFDSLTDGATSNPKKGDASAEAGRAPPPSKPPTPTSQWSFDQATNGVITDTFGRNPGALQRDDVQATWTDQGKRGGGLAFPAVADSPWMLVPSLANAAFPRVATIALWVRVRSFTKEGAEPFVADDPSGTGANVEHAPIAIYLSSDIITLELSSPFPEDAGADFDDTPFVEDVSVTAFKENTWALIVMGWDVPNNVARLLVREDGKEATATKDIPFPRGFVTVKPSFSFSCFDGVIDEVRYYDHLLTPAEMNTVD